ncbi:MAG TPA: DMT family transporter [Vicinamibacterales bacterium]|nr:DMT family transporter [Vicinamibacterales bacterium]
MGFLAMTLVVLVYAANFVAVRYSVQHGLTSFDLAALRFGAAGGLLLPYLVKTGIGDLGGIGWPRGLALACLAGAPYSVVFFLGLSRAPASHGAVLNPGLVPSVVFLVLVALGHARFSMRRVVSLVCIIVGLVLVTQSAFSARGEMLLGDALLLLTGISWGLFTVLLRVWNVRPLQAAAVVSAISLVYVPVYFAVWYHGVAASVPHMIAQAVLQGVFNSVIAIFLLTFAVRRLGAQLTALFSPSIPVLTTLLAIPLLGEVPTVGQWFGVAIVFVGMLSAASGT